MRRLAGRRRQLAEQRRDDKLEREHQRKQLCGDEASRHAHRHAAPRHAHGGEHLEAIRRHASCADCGRHRCERNGRRRIVRVRRFCIEDGGGADAGDIQLRGGSGHEPCELFGCGDAGPHHHNHEERDGDLRDGGERVLGLRRRGSLQPHIDGDKPFDASGGRHAGGDVRRCERRDDAAGRTGAERRGGERNRKRAGDPQRNGGRDRELHGRVVPGNSYGYEAPGDSGCQGQDGDVHIRRQ